MKTCFKCLQKKSFSEFYKHAQMKDGYLNKCKDCSKKDVHEYRSNNRDFYVQYDKARYNLPHRVDARKKYQQSSAGKLVHHNATKKWRKSNAQKYKAHNILNNAIRDKKITKQNCKLCGSDKSQAHHSDYSQPLKVKWYCAKCHAFKHNVEKIKAPLQ